MSYDSADANGADWGVIVYENGSYEKSRGLSGAIAKGEGYNLSQEKKTDLFFRLFAPYFCSNEKNYVPPRKLLKRRFICDQS